MDKDKTEPNTLRALAADLARVEGKLDAALRSHAANMEIVLGEMRRHGLAIGELAKAVADALSKLAEHDAWERQRAAEQSSAERPANGAEGETT